MGKMITRPYFREGVPYGVVFTGHQCGCPIIHHGFQTRQKPINLPTPPALFNLESFRKTTSPRERPNNVEPCCQGKRY